MSSNGNETLEIEIEQILQRAGLSATDEIRAYFRQAYPLFKSMLADMRIDEARYAEPATVYAAMDTRK